MLKVIRREKDYLLTLENHNINQTIFTTKLWVDFLEKNQKIEPIILDLMDGKTVKGVFVGGLIKKAGIKILGSPFEGWLTPDMGFIVLDELDFNDAIQVVANYAFKELKCWIVQIEDKKIIIEKLNPKYHVETDKLLYMDINKSDDEVLKGFTKNGRRDVRASERKGVKFIEVSFDEQFVETHYKQLEDVFDKQGLKPFYSIDKLIDLVEFFKDYPERVVALEAISEDGTNVASNFTFGYKKWAYYVGAASYREHQKLLPNEGLVWKFIQSWKEKGIINLDLVGYRQYKMKYAPEIIEVPVVMIERFPGVIMMKNLAKKAIVMKRKIISFLK